MPMQKAATCLATISLLLAVAVRAEQPTPTASPSATPTPAAPSVSHGKHEETSRQTAQQPLRMQEVVVEGQRIESSASAETITGTDLALKPHDTMHEVLNDLPGLLAVQHQGGGKAPQYLIRGFDADHGTDIAVLVDDLPVNLVSHAHGQGYADLNFVIPETIDRLDLYKGPYYPQFGDFDNAGALSIATRDEVPENYVKAEGGSFGLQRYVAIASPRLSGIKTIFAAQAYLFDGPFIHPEDYTRFNLFGKITAAPTPDSKLVISADGYRGKWNGSGQIPLREVSAGLLDRFGSIDPAEGGITDREDLNIHYTYTPTAQDVWTLQLYASRYKLALFSNFTFFKDTGLRFIREPDGTVVDTRAAPPVPGANYIPGDGIEQNDSRILYGGRAGYTRYWMLADRPMESRFGIETRNDDIELGLYRQVRRNRFFIANKVNVVERSVSGFTSQRLFFNKWLRLEAGLRGDVFFFRAHDRLPTQKSDPNFDSVPIQGGAVASIVSPKASLILTPVSNTDVYFNFGTGFHSNDARDAILTRNTDTSPLAHSIGWEVGTRTRQFERLDLEAAFWFLDLDSELVFSGDAGNQEIAAGGNFVPSRASRRWGLDFDGRYQIFDWMRANYYLGYTDPRFRSSGEAIPLAPTLMMNGDVTVDLAAGFSAALRFRFLDDRPAIEDRSLTARGYTLFDLIANYRRGNVLTFIQLLNVGDHDWREAQFSDNSCVRQELGVAVGCATKPGKQDMHPVDARPDVHFTPGNPFAVSGGLQVFF